MRSRDDMGSGPRPTRSPRRRTSRSPLPRRRSVPVVLPFNYSVIMFSVGNFNEEFPCGCYLTVLTLELNFFVWLFNYYYYYFFRSVERSRLGYRARTRLGSQERRRRSREKDDKFKGSLSEGMKAEQDDSDEEV